MKRNYCSLKDTFEDPFKNCKSYYIEEITTPRYQHHEWIVDIRYHLEFPSREEGDLWIYDVPLIIPMTNVELYKHYGNAAVVLKGRLTEFSQDIMCALQAKADEPCWSYKVTKPTSPKPMTIAEIEKKLGYPVVIVKEE